MTPGTTTLLLEGCLDRLAPETRRPATICCGTARSTAPDDQRHAGSVSACPVRFEQTDDILNQALLRVNRMLDRVEVVSVPDYLRLAAANIRRELIDLLAITGPHGMGANQADRPPGSGDGATVDYPAGDGPTAHSRWPTGPNFTNASRSSRTRNPKSSTYFGITVCPWTKRPRCWGFP